MSTASWMKDNWELLSKKPLFRICLPGSHDSGTFTVTHETRYGTKRVTKTQFLDIQEQLMQGVRFFDLRPVFFGGGFFTAHYTDLSAVQLGYQGAIGVNLEVALGHVKDFVSGHANELVILDFSHFLNWDDKGPLTEGGQERLCALVKSSLADVLICGADDTNLCNVTIAELMADGRSVIALFGEGVVLAPSSPGHGLWPKSALQAKGSYSNSDDLGVMISKQLEHLTAARRGPDPFMFELCWQLTLQGVQNGPTGTQSVLKLAEQANAALYPELVTWMDLGIINQEIYPNVITTDACSDVSVAPGDTHGGPEAIATRAVELSLLINTRLKV